ncbi:1091_t:CDS:2 [Cetraspora pellucida]|uniref:1091_t:CDS:1 n=1 Tax=Cetraspora pellucida TaxID=1433469 RepID=A0ACA9M090_9GLOM|nr:1091_t:CDS:2 [Cetraspora pellucida]
MDNNNSQSSFLARQIDKLIADPITRSNNPASETRSTSAKSDNDAPNVPIIKKTKLSRKSGSKRQSWVWKYFVEKKIIETVQNLDNQKINVEVTYGICNILNDLSKCCDSQVKVSGGSTSNLISHLLNTYNIMQNGPGLSEQDDDNDKTCGRVATDKGILALPVHGSTLNLKLTYVRYLHTANVIRETLENTIANWSLIGKVHAITSNNRSNMKAAITRIIDVIRIPCAAHTLQLVVGKGLMPAEVLVVRAKWLINFFMTLKQNEQLEEAQKTLKILDNDVIKKTSTYLRVKIDVPTCWNSSFLAWERLLLIKNVINIVITTLTVSGIPEAQRDAKRLKEIQLTKDEWDLMRDLVDILGLFYETTEELAPTQKHQAETALRNKYNDIKSSHQSLTPSDKSVDPRENQDNQEGQCQIYQKTFFKTIFMQDALEELDDELDYYFSLPEIHYKLDPFKW